MVTTQQNMPKNAFSFLCDIGLGKISSETKTQKHPFCA
jgi:hypothetical protein